MSRACPDHVILGKPAMTMDGTWLWQQNNGFQSKATGLPGLPHPNDGANRKEYYRLLSTPEGFDKYLPHWAPDVAASLGQECCHKYG